MKTQIIQLDNHDDLISARDKMAWSKAPRILLVWPQKGKLLERTVDLLILQRYGQSLGAQIGVVSRSLTIQSQARELGIPNFRNVSQAQRQVWRRPRGRKRINFRLMERKPAAANLRDQFGLLTKEREGTTEKSWMRIVFFSLGILSILLLALLFMPSAQIRLYPAQREQKLELSLRASPDIPSANASGGLPAYSRNVVVEGSDLERSSGKVSVPKSQARGMVVISNLSQDEVLIPAGAVFSTTGKEVKRYESTRDVRVPAGLGSKAEVEVRALVPGKQGNVPIGAIQAMEGSQGLTVAVENLQPITGGSDQVGSGPTQQDYARLRERLIQSLRQTAIADLKRNLGAEHRLLDGTVAVVEILNENLSPPADQPGDYARLSMQVEFSAWYVKEDDLQTVARAALEVNRDDGFVAESAPVMIEFLDEPDANLQWRAVVSRAMHSAIDPDRVARAVVWKSPDSAKAALMESYLLAGPVDIKVFPNWWFRLPFLSFRIHVEMN